MHKPLRLLSILIFTLIISCSPKLAFASVNDTVLQAISPNFWGNKNNIKITYIEFVNNQGVNFPNNYSAELVDSILKETPFVREIHIYQMTLFTIPSQIFQLKHIQKLFLNNCSISLISDSVFFIPSLIQLDLQGNPILKFPEIRSFGSSILTLSFVGTKISEIPSSIFKLCKLRILLLDQNDQYIKLPSSMIKIRSLICISMRGNGILELPKVIYKLEHLEYLNILDTGLDCEFVRKKLKQSVRLDCS